MFYPLIMKKNTIIILILICFVGFFSSAWAQDETRVTGTVRVHPWINLPVVISTDLQGGLQSLGTLALTASPTTVLNSTVPDFERISGMVITVIDSDSNNKTRYFEYQGGDTWNEIFVINAWQPSHAYVQGDYVVYEGNFYVANSTFTSDATTFANNGANWNNAGGKDGKYTATEIKMDSQTLSKVAASGTTVADADKDKTLATAGFVLTNAGGSTFDANRIITRTGLDGITGQNFQTTNVTDFLNKIFFPVLSPMITSFRYNENNAAGQFSYQDQNTETKVVSDHPGTVSFTYASWSSLPNLVFKYNITKRDEASSIIRAELFKGGVSQGAITDGATSGSFSLDKAGFTNIDATQNIPLTLTVTDNASNVVNLVLNTSFTQASGVTLSSTRISPSAGGAALVGAEGAGTSTDPYLIERTGADFNYYFNWTINSNDDAGAVTDIDFSGSPALIDLSGTNITQTNTSVSLPHTDASTVYRVGARARGSVANDWSGIVYSSYYQLQDKLYCGFLPSNLIPSEAQIKALQQSSLKTATYYSTTGVTLTNNTGGSGFFSWAVPTYVDGGQSAPAFSRKAYFYATGQWFENTNVSVHAVKLTAGGTSSWYWICIYNASIANGGSIQVKLSN